MEAIEPIDRGFKSKFATRDAPEFARNTRARARDPRLIDCCLRIGVRASARFSVSARRKQAPVQPMPLGVVVCVAPDQGKLLPIVDFVEACKISS